MMEWLWIYISFHRCILTLGFIGLIGFSSSNSESTQREEWFGSVECPETLLVEWNELLSRPPYVQRNASVLSGNSSGLFTGIVSLGLIFHMYIAWNFKICVSKMKSTMQP